MPRILRAIPLSDREVIVMSVIAVNTTRTRTERGFDGEDGEATVFQPTRRPNEVNRRSAAVIAVEDVLEGVELFEALTGANNYCEQRVFGNLDRHTRFDRQPKVEAA